MITLSLHTVEDDRRDGGTGRLLIEIAGLRQVTSPLLSIRNEREKVRHKACVRRGEISGKTPATNAGVLRVVSIATNR